MSFVVTNKWLKAAYGEPLRRFFAESAWVESVVDFGHAKQIFEDADVFPSIIVARKPTSGPAPTTTRVCLIPREQLRVEDLSRQIEDAGIEIPRARLTASSWSLEPVAADDLLVKLQRVGSPLKDFASVHPLFGIKTGLNQAFLIDTPTKQALIAADPESTNIIRPYIRGQDVDRWHAAWVGLWMIALKSSGDHPWPWADAGEEAEAVFARTYPSIHRHLSYFREALIKRQDQGRYWWELRTCAYWDRFDRPKLFYQDITWQAQVCYDDCKTLSNNTVYFLPSDDLWIMAVLNSPIGWWYAWRKAQHGKDEALRYFTDFVEAFPIPRPAEDQRKATEAFVRRLIALRDATHRRIQDLLHWLKVEYEIVKPSMRLQSPIDLECDAFIAEVRKLRGKKKPLSLAALRNLRDEHERTIVPAQALAHEARTLEQQVSDLVNAAYGLTPSDMKLMWETAPPRMPVEAPAFSHGLQTP